MPVTYEIVGQSEALKIQLYDYLNDAERMVKLGIADAGYRLSLEHRSAPPR